jgi:ABC-2 type transport system permease protein
VNALTAELVTLRALFLRSLRANFAYKSMLFMSLLSAGFAYAIPMLVWRHVYAANPRALPVPADELFSYLLVAGILNYASIMNVESRVGHRIRLGLVATDLLRPVDFQATQAAQALGDGFFNLLLMLPLFGLAYAIWGEVALPDSPVALAAFALSVLLSLAILFAVSFIFVQATFISNSGYGVFMARSAMQLTFSGLSAPLVLFPDTLRRISEFLPFHHTIHTPAAIYLGWIEGAAIVPALAAQLAWALGLIVLGRWLLGVALPRFEIQGG